MDGPRDARQEAIDRVGGRYDARVLEPSPPAVNEPPWFADDPVAGGEVVPVDRAGAMSWAELCAHEADPDLDRWCADRWLGPWRRLDPLPAAYIETRLALHALAEHVISPARHAANAKIGLRYTWRGFGTPFFGDDEQVRIEGTELVTAARRVPLSTLRELSEAVGVAPGVPTGVYEPATPAALDEPLAVDPAAAAAVADWFGFCASVLEQVRAEPPDATRLQLWPEHFDLAIDFGDEAEGRRANYGGSPGDEDHPEPYLYVGPWIPQQGAFWNAPFGARLSYTDLLGAPDQRAAALDFLREGWRLLTSR